MDVPSPARHALHQVAVHVIARARQQATGRFSLRITPGGFGTPEFGPDSKRVRVAGGSLVVEVDAAGAPMGGVGVSRILQRIAQLQPLRSRTNAELAPSMLP